MACVACITVVPMPRGNRRRILIFAARAGRYPFPADGFEMREAIGSRGELSVDGNDVHLPALWQENTHAKEVFYQLVGHSVGKLAGAPARHSRKYH